jgi:NADH-quinone oxidoreductase subunit L
MFAAQFHLFNHSIFKALLFLSAGAIIHAVHTRNMYEMRGLKKDMPKTRWLMLVGALALAGVPIFSGFWSKDLIFAGALEEELWIPLALVVVTAILTVAYSLRMYFLVFEGEGKREHPAHEAPGIMLLVLAILAAGAVLSWAFVQVLSTAFTAGLGVHTHELGDFVVETFANVAVLLSLLALGVGFLLYWFRNQLKNNFITQEMMRHARKGFWFDDFYDSMALGVKKASLRLSRLQTGDANVNFIGIVLVILMLLAMLIWQGVL